MPKRSILTLLALAPLIALHFFLEAPAFQTELNLSAPSSPRNDLGADAHSASFEPSLERPLRTSESATEAEENAPVRVRRAQTPALSRTLNVLLIGIDRRPGEKYGGRPDTIVVAALSEKDGHLGLISVPRDLYVEIPHHGMDRINATFAAAARRKDDPLELLKRVLEDTLALPISHTFSIDLAGFEQVIDSIGGVDVDVPCPIRDNFVDARTPSGRRLLDVEAGRTHLDGVTASLYVRSRHGRSDFSRSRRQQAVLFATLRRLSSVEGIARLPDFLDKLGPLITSDASRADVLRLAHAASRISPGQVHGLVLGAKEASPHLTAEGKAVLLPHFDNIDRRLHTLFSAATPGELPSASPCIPRDAALTRRAKRNGR